MFSSATAKKEEQTATLVKSLSNSSQSGYQWGMTIDSTNRLLLACTSATPRYILFDLETLKQVGSFNSNEQQHSYGFTCVFLSENICAVTSSHQIEIFSFKREDPPKEKKHDQSIKISDCTQIKVLPLNDQSSALGNSHNHTIISLNSISLNKNNNSAQLVLASHRESCLSFWKTPSKNQLDDGNQYHQVGFLNLEEIHNFKIRAQFCRARYYCPSSSSSSSSCSDAEGNFVAHVVATSSHGFCLFKVSWSKYQQKEKEEVTIQLLREIDLNFQATQDSYGCASIDVARHFVATHTAYGIGYLYDMENFRVVSELKTETGSQSDFATIRISEDADVVVLGTRKKNVHIFSNHNNNKWEEVTAKIDTDNKEKILHPAIQFGNDVYDIHLCAERQLVIVGGLVDQTAPMKVYRCPLLRNRWRRRRNLLLISHLSECRLSKLALTQYVTLRLTASFL